MILSSPRSLIWSVKKACYHGYYHQLTPLLRRHLTTMVSRTYDDAIDQLNSLQTPFKVLSERWGKKHDQSGYKESVGQMRKCLELIGYTQDDLTKLNVVHVAGTKGKGSTCAYVDSILSQYTGSRGGPHSVGLFTSPHLISVRERIRIDSEPLSRELFTKYFFEVWDRFSDVPGSLKRPIYFRYLTLMSFHVFIQEKVDTAIYEVGVGGEYDATNIIDHPAATGISNLGIDHTFTLGETLEQIAWHKAGIFKKGVPAFTVSQLPSALDVVSKRAAEREVSKLIIVGNGKTEENDAWGDGGVDWRPLKDQQVTIRPDAEFQELNASLAVSLAHSVLNKLDPTFELPWDYDLEEYVLPEEFKNGLEQTVWHGRCEKKVERDITWYLDGAHTADSIKIASEWFSNEAANLPATHVLIFNQQGHRDIMQLLENLHKCIDLQGKVKFEHVLFCPTLPVISSGSKGSESMNRMTDPDSIATLETQKAFVERWKELDPSSSAQVKALPSVEDAIAYARNLSRGPGEFNDGEATGKQVHVFITGSIHLVGRALAILEGVDAL